MATKQEVQTVEAQIPDITPLATKTELNAVENLIPDISNLATKNEVALVEAQIPDISGLATKQEVQTVEARIPDITPLATKTELNTVENLIPTVPENISAFNNDANYITDNVLRQNLLVANALTTGNVSDNAVVYADIEEKYHSSFDLSKFTVVGNPIITDDGIASGLVYNTAFILTNCIVPVSTANFWSVKINNFKVSSLSASQRFFSFYANNTFVYIRTDGTLRTYISSSTTGDIANDVYVNYTTQIGEILNIKFCFTGIAYEVWINGNKTYSKDSTTKISSNQAMVVYAGGSGYAPCIGEHDLKQFSITVDGAEVFSGNKTGIDTIKPDNYTVVGSPSITDYGILTPSPAATDGDCFYSKPITIKDADILKIAFKANLLTSYSSGTDFISPNGVLFGGLFYTRLMYDNGIKLYAYDGTSTGNVTIASADYLGKEVYFDLEVSKNIRKLSLSLDNKTWSTVSNTTTLAWSGTNSNYILQPIQQSMNGIDLNNFKIYVNGKLVYQPCLKIPYTLTKGGAKIVDAAKRLYVEDMYNQFGYAPYYTIDTENKNFTLPMGDLYGIIQKLSDRIANLET